MLPSVEELPESEEDDEMPTLVPHDPLLVPLKPASGGAPRPADVLDDDELSDPACGSNGDSDDDMPTLISAGSTAAARPLGNDIDDDDDEMPVLVDNGLSGGHGPRRAEASQPNEADCEDNTSAPGTQSSGSAPAAEPRPPEDNMSAPGTQPSGSAPAAEPRPPEEQARWDEAADALELAEAEMAKSRLKEAHRLVEKATLAFKELGDKRQTATASEKLAAVLLAQDRVDKSLQVAGRALELHRELGDRNKEAAVLRTLSRTLVSKGSAAEALERAKESQAICRDIGDQKGEAAALECAACAYLAKQDDVAGALGMALRSAKLCEEIGEHRGEIAALQTAAGIHLAGGDVGEALQVATEALEVARRSKDTAIIGSSLELVLNIHLQNGESSDKANSAIEEEVALAHESGDLKREVTALQALAQLKVADSKQQEALELARKAQELCKRLEDKKVEAAALSIVADHLREQMRFDEALEVVAEAESLLRALGDVPALVQILQLETSLHSEKEDVDAAVKASYAQRTVYSEAGYADLEASTLLGIADFLSVAKGPREALQPAQESLALFRQLMDKEGEAGALLSLAQLQMSLELPREALKYAQEAELASRSIGDISGQASALQIAANIYVVQQKHADAARVAGEARDLLREAGDIRGEAAAWQIVAQVHLGVCMKSVEAGRNAEPRVAKDALKTSEAALKLFRAAEDLEGQASALQMVATAHLHCGDADSALLAARESLEAAEITGSAPAVAAALLSMSQAYLSQGDIAEAVQVAQEGGSIAQEAGDEQGFASAQELLVVLEQAMRPQVRQAPISHFGGGRGFSEGPRSMGGGRSGEGQAGRPHGQQLGAFSSGLRGYAHAATTEDAAPAKGRGKTASGAAPLFERQNFGVGGGFGRPAR